MKAKIQSDSLLQALRLATAVADHQPIGLRADSDGLTFTASDGSVTVSTTVTCEIDTPGPESSISPDIGPIIEALSEETPPALELQVRCEPGIELAAVDKSWTIRAPGSEACINPAIPAMPSDKNVNFSDVHAAELVDLIDKTLFSVSTDETRINLNGALFESDGKRATIVSTDGHRLTKYSRPFEGPDFGDGVVIPRRGLKQIQKMALGDTCKIGVSDTCFFVKTETFTLSVLLMIKADRFPPWRTVVPKTYSHRVSVGRDALSRTLRLAMPCTTSPDRLVVLSFEGGSASVSSSRHGGSLSFVGEVQLLEHSQLQDGFTVGLNANYLLGALGHLESDVVNMEFGDELDPCVLRPDGIDGYVAIIMPQRI